MTHDQFAKFYEKLFSHDDLVDRNDYIDIKKTVSEQLNLIKDQIFNEVFVLKDVEDAIKCSKNNKVMTLYRMKCSKMRKVESLTTHL